MVIIKNQSSTQSEGLSPRILLRPGWEIIKFEAVHWFERKTTGISCEQVCSGLALPGSRLSKEPEGHVSLYWSLHLRLNVL